MASNRIVNKSLVTEQDTVFGIGAVTQTRNNVPYTLDKLAVSRIRNTLADLVVLDADVGEVVEALNFSNSPGGGSRYLVVENFTIADGRLVVDMTNNNQLVRQALPIQNFKSKADIVAADWLAEGDTVVLTPFNTSYVIEASGTQVTVFKDLLLTSTLVAKWKSGISSLTSRDESVEFKPEDKYFGGQNAIAEGGGVLILGDSITQGFGASGTATEDFDRGFANKFIRSSYNSEDQGYNQDRGYRYETNLSLQAALSQPGVSTTGTVETAGGVVDSFISLTAGQTITITGRQITFCDVYYTSASGALEFRLNGVLYDTKALTGGGGVFWTFPTQITSNGAYINEGDVVTITATATVNITGLVTLRTSNASYASHLIVAAKSGFALDDFNNPTRAQVICDHMNLIKGSSSKILVLVMLGTNDIYNPLHANDPSSYVAELSALISTYKANLTAPAEFIISVPPEAAAPTTTVTGDAYLEYVNQIINFCQLNEHQLLRLDKSVLSGSDTYLFDTLHPNEAGATILARELCRTVGVPYNPSIAATVLSSPPAKVSLITYSDTWGDLTPVSCVLDTNTLNVILAGLAQKNGSVSTTIGTLPVGCRPSTTRFCTVFTDTGSSNMLTINTDGTLVLATVPTNWISFDGLSFRIS